MALDSYFELDTTASPQEVKALILRELLFNDEDWNGLTRLLDASSIITIRRPTRPDPTCQEVGIDPKLTIGIVCRDKLDFDLVQQWDRNRVKIPMLLLKTYPGDAMQLTSTSLPSLMRKDGELYLLNRKYMWMQSDGTPVPELTLIDLPYTNPAN
jgi:hypothetical protein